MVEIVGLGVVVLVQLATVIWMFATLTAKVRQIDENVKKLADLPDRVTVVETKWDEREKTTNPGGFRRRHLSWNDGES